MAATASDEPCMSKRAKLQHTDTERAKLQHTDTENAERLVEELYTSRDLSIDAAFSISEADIKHVNTLSGSAKAVNYGEVLLSSWATVLLHVGLGPDDVFLDLGSGRGLLVLYTQLSCGVRRSIGVELSRERHAIATRALALLRTRDPRAAAATEFRNEDMRATDLSEATCVFLMNADLPHKLVAAVWERLLQRERPCVVLTLYAPRDVEASRLPPRETLSRIPQSWNSNTDVLVYRLPGSASS